MRYRIKLKDTDKVKIITAPDELGAKMKYCEEQGFNYRVFANKLEVEPATKEKRK